MLPVAPADFTALPITKSSRVGADTAYQSVREDRSSFRTLQDPPLTPRQSPPAKGPPVPRLRMLAGQTTAPAVPVPPAPSHASRLNEIIDTLIAIDDKYFLLA